MPNQYLNSGVIQENPWVLLDHGTEQMERLIEQSGLPPTKEANISHTHVIVALDNVAEFVANTPAAERPIIAVLVDGFSETAQIQETLSDCNCTVDAFFVDFPVFSDGRGYSLTQLLLREYPSIPVGAIGDILQDQIFFYWRCGLSLLSIRKDQDIQACAASLNTFSYAYQPAYCQPRTQSV